MYKMNNKDISETSMTYSVVFSVKLEYISHIFDIFDYC